VGVTGGLASGKTTVADMLVKKGAVKIDVDALGHRLLSEDGGVKEGIIGLFGDKVLSGGKIDRDKLRKEVFSDSGKALALNGLMHPLMVEVVKKEIERFQEGVLLVDAALLIEMGLDKYVDVIVLVTADDGNMVKRAVNRDISEEEAATIMAHQMPVPEKKRHADHIIDNNGNIDETKKGVDELWKKIQKQ